MAKKKLMIASDTFLPRWDGVSRSLAEIVPRLSQKYETTLLVPDFNHKKIRIKNVEIIALPIHKFMIGDYRPPKLKSKAVKKIVKKADIVFTQTIGPIGACAIIYAKRLKKPLYAYIHSIEWELVPKSIDKFKNVFSFITKSLARYLYNKCDMIFVPSMQIEKTLAENSIGPEKRIVPLGVNSDEFKPAEKKEEAKKRIGIDPDSTVLGYVGRIGREKDLPTLYRAFRKLTEKYANLKLLIVGPGLRLEDVFKDMEEVKDSIIYIESTNKAWEYYQAMDIFVLPSLTETSSLSTMEAMSCALPVIATDVGCIKEYIKDGKNGYIFEKGNHEMLAKKILKLIDNGELRKAIGYMARKTIIARFSWEKTIKEIEKVLG